MTRIVRFPASKPPRQTGPEVLNRLREEEELREMDERERRIEAGEQLGAVVTVALFIWFLWASK